MHQGSPIRLVISRGIQLQGSQRQYDEVGKKDGLHRVDLLQSRVAEQT